MILDSIEAASAEMAISGRLGVRQAQRLKAAMELLKDMVDEWANSTDVYKSNLAMLMGEAILSQIDTSTLDDATIQYIKDTAGQAALAYAEALDAAAKDFNAGIMEIDNNLQAQLASLMGG